MPLFLPSKRAALRASIVCTLAVALPGLTSAAGGTTTADLSHCTTDVFFDQANAKINKADGTTELHKVVVKACDTEIQADRARTNKLDIDNAKWTFDGNVHIRSTEQRSRLNSDRAVVQFRNNEVASIDIDGNPAEFEQQRPDSDVVTRGRAGHIVYEAGQGTISMQDDVWLSDGSKTYKGQELVYDIRKQEVDTTRRSQSTVPGSDRVHITINPRAMKKDDGKPASSATPPADAPPPAKP